MMDSTMNVVERWEAIGVLEGLPLWEKEELSQIFDNATRIILSEITSRDWSEEHDEILTGVYLPILRRLYRRVGPNFNIENIIPKLLDVVSSEKGKIKKQNPTEPEQDPMLQFCINFADDYEDEETKKNFLSDEDYEKKVDDLLGVIKEILLNSGTVSNVEKDGADFKINYGQKKSKQQTRYWNQKIVKQVLNFVISDINKGT